MSTSEHVDIPLRWADMDSFGHVNNVVFVRYLEQARVEVMAAWIPRRNEIFGGIVVARQEIDYVGQLRYRPEPLRCDVWVSRVGGGSFDIAYVLRDPDGVGEQRYAVAESTIVTFDFATNAPRRLADAEREALSARSGGPAPLRRRRVEGGAP